MYKKKTKFRLLRCNLWIIMISYLARSFFFYLKKLLGHSGYLLFVLSIHRAKKCDDSCSRNVVINLRQDRIFSIPYELMQCMILVLCLNLPIYL